MTILEKINSLTWLRLKEILKDLKTETLSIEDRIGTIENTPSGDSRPYKVFTATMYQNGLTAVPTIYRLFENTFGMTPIITRQTTGRYLFTLPTIVGDKTYKVCAFFTRIGGIVPIRIFTFTVPTNQELYVDVKDITDVAADIDGYFLIEIRVYN
jgi:hypothetical protein